MWQGIELFYQGETFDETISNLSTLIQRAQEQGLGRAERLLTVRLRDAELGRFMADRERAVAYADTTLDIMEATDIELQGILSGTVPISPSLTVTEAMAAHTTAAYAQIYAQPYPNQQQALLDAVDVAERFYSELQGQELELQQELRAVAGRRRHRRTGLRLCRSDSVGAGLRRPSGNADQPVAGHRRVPRPAGAVLRARPGAEGGGGAIGRPTRHRQLARRTRLAGRIRRPAAAA